MNELRILPLGGWGEIGKNCLILEYQDEILIVDCGVMFGDLDEFGVEFIIPDFSYLLERKEKVSAVMITHGHEDHIGAIPYLLKAGINAPIYTTRFTSLLIQERLSEHDLFDKVEMKLYSSGEKLKFKHFNVTPVATNHSVVEAHAFIIDTPVGKIIHTGDFKMDAEPYYGKPFNEEPFRKAGAEGVALLLSDSTNIESANHSISESKILDRFGKFFSEAPSLVVVTTFASNVSRIGQVFELAKRLNKRVAVAGRSMEQNVRLGVEAGYLDGCGPLMVSVDDVDSYDRRNLVLLCTGSQGEYRSALNRISLNEHRDIQLQPGDLVIVSSRFIPGNELAISRVINNLFKLGADVFYETLNEVHVSGHACRPELKRMLELVKPKFFMPVHGEYRHLVHHANLARETGVKDENAVIASDGEVLSLTRDGLNVIDRFECKNVLIENPGRNIMTPEVIKERRKLAESGVVFVYATRKRGNGKISSKPEISTRGLVSEDMAEWIIEGARKCSAKVVQEYEKSKSPGETIEETLRIELRRYFKQVLGKKPTVVPVIIEA